MFSFLKRPQIPKVEKSYVYPDTFYEDYDDIKERGDTARNILLLHYLEGKQARKARITAELKALEEEEQMEKEQESTGNPSEPADTDTQKKRVRNRKIKS